ncbi:MAG: hypothetical protein IPK16_32300 [Anaerolineales bacterium]|nr:hypothetical protein [Anaerolineales bacterium]
MVAEPLGAVNLHQRTFNEGGLILAGLEGSIRYNTAPRYQYTQSEMWMNIWRLAPKLLINRIRYGRYLDVLVAHSPPWEIHDQDDRPHQGFKSFLTFMRWFKPRYLLHGHIHIYRRDVITETTYAETQVINAYPYKVLDQSPVLRLRRPKPSKPLIAYSMDPKRQPSQSHDKNTF